MSAEIDLPDDVMIEAAQNFFASQDDFEEDDFESRQLDNYR